MLARSLGGPEGTSKVDTYEVVNSTFHSSRKRAAYHWVRGASQVCPSPYTSTPQGASRAKGGRHRRFSIFLMSLPQAYLAKRNAIRTRAGKSTGCPSRFAGLKRICFAA